MGFEDLVRKNGIWGRKSGGLGQFVRRKVGFWWGKVGLGDFVRKKVQCWGERVEFGADFEGKKGDFEGKEWSFSEGKGDFCLLRGKRGEKWNFGWFVRGEKVGFG